ncbi:MAG: ribonuclease HII [Candidatus Aminicenantes bacterium]|nr:ribonuclease HII [Candidatus Aminicenantes bacterium]
MTCSFNIEKELLNQNYSHICGIDEVGRGALFGPVVSGAVILNPNRLNFEIDDSKKIPPRKREILAEDIYESADAFSIGWCWNDGIDEMNILNATKTSMKLALMNLQITPDYVLMDGLKPDFIYINGEGIIKGDSKSISIAAASIIAKVFRDDLMKQFSKYFTEYGLDRNKGYPTREHIHSLNNTGITSYHRKSFKIKNG